MDLMDDEDLKKSVIGQMMGELDDVTADSLKKPAAGAKGVEISITVTPHAGEEEEGDEKEMCDEEGCEDPAHMHEAKEEEPEAEGNYISDLMKKMG